MAEIRTGFQNQETASKYKYSGSWAANGKEKRVSWPRVYDGLVCEMPPHIAAKFVEKKHPEFSEINPVAVKSTAGEEE